MSFIDLPFTQLSGGESPHQKIGAPRIRKVTNGHMEQIGRIVREPGWAETTIAQGANVLWGDALSGIALGGSGLATVYSLGETGLSETNDRFFVSGLCRRIPSLPFGGASFGSCGITPQAIVAVDENTGEICACPISSPVTLGEVRSGGGVRYGSSYEWCGAIGAHVIGSKASTVHVLLWDDSSGNLISQWDDTTANGGGPCGVTEDDSDILIINENGWWYRISKSDYSRIAFGVLSFGGNTPVPGTFSCSISGDYIWVSFCDETKAYIRRYSYPGFSGGAWDDMLISDFVSSSVSSPQLCAGSDPDTCISLVVGHQSTTAGTSGPFKTTIRAHGTSATSQSLRGAAAITPPALVGTAEGVDVFHFAATVQPVGGAYCHTVLFQALLDGDTLLVSPIAVMGKGASLGSQEESVRVRGNVCPGQTIKSDEFGEASGSLFPVRFSRTLPGDAPLAGIDIGAVETAPYDWAPALTAVRPIDFGVGAGISSGGVPRRVMGRVVPGVDMFEPSAPVLSEEVDPGPAAGEYHYRVTIGAETSLGETIQSPPSGDSVITTSGGAISARVFAHLQSTTRQGSSGMERFHLWRDNGRGGKVYRRVTPPEGVASPSLDAEYIDTLSVDDWEYRPILYTQGSMSALSGRLPAWAPPAHACSSIGPDRVIVGVTEMPRRVVLSDTVWAGTVTQWIDSTATEIYLPEDNTAVASTGGGYLAASRNGWWVFYGPGPDSQGNGRFTELRKINAPCGPASWRQVVETPEGVVYQGIDGQFYMILPDCSGTVALSEGSVSWVDRDPTVDPISSESTRLAAAMWFDPLDGMVRAAMRPTPSADTSTTPMVVINPNTRDISEDTGACVHDSILDLPLSVFSLGGETYWSRQGATSFLLTKRSYSSPEVARDRNGNPAGTVIELSCIYPGGMGSWSRIRRIMVHCSMDGLPALYAGGGLLLDVHYDGEDSYWESLTVGEPSSLAGMVSFEFCPARQKCQGVTLVIRDYTDGKTKSFHAVTLDGSSFERTSIREKPGSVRA